MKKRKWLCIFMAGQILLSAGCTAQDSQKEKETATQSSTQACDAAKSDCTDTQVSMEELDGQMEEITMEDAIALFEDGGSGLIYFGFDACPWCEEALPVLLEEADAAGQAVLFVRTRDADKELLYTREQKEQILPYLKDYMSENDEGEMTLYVPCVVMVRDGVVVDGHVGTVDGHDAKERQMNDEEIEELRAVYQRILAQ